MFFAFFGAAWLILGALRSGHASFLFFAVVLLIAASIFFLALRHYGVNRSAREAVAETPASRRRSRWFNIINALQWFAIFLVSNILANLHHGEWIIPAIILIVGLHFFPLARLFCYPPHYITGAVLVLIAAGYPFLAPGGPASPAGSFATGLVLWVSALYGLST